MGWRETLYRMSPTYIENEIARAKAAAGAQKASQVDALRQRLRSLGVHDAVIGQRPDGAPITRPELAPDAVEAFAEVDVLGVDTTGTRAALESIRQSRAPASSVMSGGAAEERLGGGAAEDQLGPSRLSPRDQTAFSNARAAGRDAELLNRHAFGFDAVAPAQSRDLFARTSLGPTPGASASSAGVARSPLGGLPLGAYDTGDGSGGYVPPTLMAARRDPRGASQSRPGQGSPHVDAVLARYGKGSRPASAPPYPKQYREADVDALTKMIATEARGEGEEGMAAVAHVALNRLKTGHRGKKTLRDVIYDEKQFTGINNPYPPEAYQPARAVALAVLNGQVTDPTAGSRFYYAPKRMPRHMPVPKWAKDKKPVETIGGHLFFNDVR